MELVVLVDYRGAFWSSTTNVRTMTTMDVGALQSHLLELGVTSRLLSFRDIDFSEDWRSKPVVYTSSEDPGLNYKSYIEDTILALAQKGAHVIPGYPILRAHHNKVFMEMLRKVYLDGDPLSSKTLPMGVLEDLKPAIDYVTTPAFVKRAAGAGASTVYYARNSRELGRRIRRSSFTSRGALSEWLRRRLRAGYVPASTHRSKLVVQEMIPGLSGDFKVLKYGSRYFAVYRSNREGDPRASGGGRLDFRIEDHVNPVQLLEYAHGIADRIPSPFLSMDIAHTQSGFFLLEFQGIHFGPATLEKSSRHWLLEANGQFRQVNEAIALERAFAETLATELR